MLMSLILTHPCKTLMVIRETKVKSWLHHITKKTSLDSNGAWILSCMLYTEIWWAVWINSFTFETLVQKKLKKQISLLGLFLLLYGHLSVTLNFHTMFSFPIERSALTIRSFLGLWWITLVYMSERDPDKTSSSFTFCFSQEEWNKYLNFNQFEFTISHIYIIFLLITLKKKQWITNSFTIGIDFQRNLLPVFKYCIHKGQ